VGFLRSAIPRMEEDLTNVSLTLEQARDLLAQLSAALDGRQGLLEIVMPNDKKMSDCTGHYVRQVSEALHRISLNDVTEFTGTSKRTAA
jgi:hypothetical protein